MTEVQLAGLDFHEKSEKSKNNHLIKLSLGEKIAKANVSSHKLDPNKLESIESDISRSFSFSHSRRNV